MKKTRLLAAALAALMLLASLASCAENLEGAETEAPADSATQPATEVEETRVQDALPELSYGNDEVTILSRYREGWSSGELTVEKITGDAVNDAVYERNKNVEERLGVRIINQEEHENDPSIYINKVSTIVKSGTHEYDLIAGPCYVCVNESLNGTFADLRKSEYLDFEKPWWSQGFNEVVEYKDSQYAVTGSVVLSMYRFAFVTVFNKELFDDHKIAYLYDDVKAGTWTLDRQIELAPIFYADNGNGIQDEEGDIYGFVSNDYISVDPYWSACMVDILSKNADGDYEIVCDTGKLHSVAEKVLKLFYETGNATYNCKHYGLDDEQVDIRNIFANGGAAMATVRLMEMESETMRNMEAEYGIVPMPKYDAAQDGHRTLLHDQFTVLCVPTTIPEERLSEVSAVMEAMGSDSYYSVRPAYYEKMMRTQIAKDPQSAEMLDVVVDHIYIDAGIIYTSALSSFHDQFRQIIGSKNNTVSSSYKSLVKRAGKSLDKMTKKLNRLVD